MKTTTRPKPATAAAEQVTPAKVAADAVYLHAEQLLKVLDVQPVELAAILRETAEWYDPQIAFALAPEPQ